MLLLRRITRPNTHNAYVDYPAFLRDSDSNQFDFIPQDSIAVAYAAYARALDDASL